MNILIFENEITSIENIFKCINLMEYNSALNITYYQTSQELESVLDLNDFAMTIIDIDLSKKSDKDGYSILNDIKMDLPDYLNKVLILTGSTRVNEKLDGLGLSDLPILLKPTDIDEVLLAMKKILE